MWAEALARPCGTPDVEASFMASRSGKSDPPTQPSELPDQDLPSSQGDSDTLKAAHAPAPGPAASSTGDSDTQKAARTPDRRPNQSAEMNRRIRQHWEE